MAWQQRTIRYWTVCWKWIFPYPCRKSKQKFCCTGVHKVRCYGFFGEHWHCCDGRESHWWGWCWGVGSVIASNITICRNSIPSESQGCPHTVGDAPPRFVSTTLGLSVGLLLGSLVAVVANADIRQGLIGGAIVGAVFGAGTGRRWGLPMTLVSLAIVMAAYWLLVAR